MNRVLSSYLEPHPPLLDGGQRISVAQFFDLIHENPQNSVYFNIGGEHPAHRANIFQGSSGVAGICHPQQTKIMKQALLDSIRNLWDELSDFEASQSEQAVRHLMQSLCRMTGAVNANWTGAMRMNQDFDCDLLQGWRIGVKLELMPLSPDPEGESFADIQRMWNDREIDPSFLLPIREVGTFRTYSLRREMPQEWFDSPFFTGFFASLGIYDGAFVGFPLNEDTESHFGFYFPRAISDEEIDLLAYALRGLKWFHRKNMLSRGLMVAETALTPAERGVLNLLLTERSVKEIAAERGLSYHTTNDHIRSIFRKFGVNNRPALMALWLGHFCAAKTGR